MRKGNQEKKLGSGELKRGSEEGKDMSNNEMINEKIGLEMCVLRDEQRR